MSTSRPPAATPRVPFLDLSLTHAGLKADLLQDLAELIDSGAFTNGGAVVDFEEEFANHCRALHCVGVGSGLDALRLALQAAGVEPGDEVVLPTMTFVATAEAVTQSGGIPVLVDVTERDLNLDIDAVGSAITARTRFVVPVHLYGQLADMRQLAELARRHEITIIEDACQAHGATREGVRAGQLALAAAYSFYPGKNLGAMGDAGAVTTDHDNLANQVRALREHGQTAKYQHDLRGWTSRLDTVHALMLRLKLPLLDSWNNERKNAAAYYLERLRGVGDLRLPPVPEDSEPVWHLFVVRTASPNQLARYLLERGIATARHYPDPVHLTGAYAHLGYRRGTFPISEAVAQECLSLPIYPGIAENQVEDVVSAIEDYFAG